MPETGYIRDELDLKFLFLYVLSNAGGPVSFDDLLEMVAIDEVANYMECADAYYGLVESGHVEETGGKAAISQRGRDALKAYDNRLPSSVRRKAQQSVMKTAARMRREACVACETKVRGRHLVTSMSMSDGDDEMMRLELFVVNRSQAALLEGNFKANAERIYNAVLDALLKDYTVEDEKPTSFREE